MAFSNQMWADVHGLEESYHDHLMSQLDEYYGSSKKVGENDKTFLDAQISQRKEEDKLFCIFAKNDTSSTAKEFFSLHVAEEKCKKLNKRIGYELYDVYAA